jgi:hypothetical protein
MDATSGQEGKEREKTSISHFKAAFLKLESVFGYRRCRNFPYKDSGCKVSNHPSWQMAWDSYGCPRSRPQLRLLEASLEYRQDDVAELEKNTL